MTTEIQGKTPSECTPEDMAAFKEVVLAGGQVRKQGLDDLIRAAHCLAFGRLDGRMVSVAAIKNPRPDYRQKVFQKASSPEDPSAFPFEYGWAHTLDGYRDRRLNSRINDVILSGLKQAIFATTDETNAAMRHILSLRGFVQSGHPYAGTKRGERKVLLIRNTDR